MPEPSPQPSTGVEPSAEAVEAMKRMLPQTAYSVHDILTAAYAIDSPAIHAAGVAEGRAAMRDEIVEWLEREQAQYATGFGPAPIVSDTFKVLLTHFRREFAIEAAFPAGEKTDGEK